MGDLVDEFLASHTPANAPVRNEAALAQYPAPVRDLAKQLGEYRLNLPGGVGRSKSPWPEAIEAAAKYNPSFDEKQYDARKNFLVHWLDQKQGLPGGKILSAKTMVNHIDELMKRSDELNNTQFTPINAAVNYLEQHLNDDPRANNYAIVRDKLGSEGEKFFTGANGETVMAKKDIANRFSENAGPRTQKDAAKTLMKLVAGQMSPLHDGYVYAMGEPPAPVFSDKERAVLQAIGLDPEEVETGKPKKSSTSTGPTVTVQKWGRDANGNPVKQ